MKRLLAMVVLLTSALSRALADPPVDKDGDALPPGAVMRLGTARWRQPGDCYCVAFSPNGSVVASGGMKSARLWDVKSGKKLAEFPHPAETLAFSADGKKIALAGNDFTVGSRGRGIALWDMETQKKLWHKAPAKDPGGEDSRYRALAFHPDGSWIAAATENSVTLHDAGTAEIILVLRHEGQRSSNARLAVSHDGNLVALSTTYDIRIWNLDAGGDPVVIKKAHDDEVGALVFTPDAKALISGGHRSELVRDAKGKPKYFESHAQIRAWDIATGARTADILKGEPSQRVRSLILSAGSSTLITVLDEEIRALHWPSGKVEFSFKLDRRVRDHWTPAASLSPDGSTLAVATDRCDFLLCDLRKREVRLAVSESHTDAVRAAAYSPDGRIIATSSADGTVRFWDAASGKQMRKLAYSTRCMNLMSVAFSPDSKFIAAAGNHWKGVAEVTGLVKVWHVASGELAHEMLLPECGLALAFSPDSSRLAVSLSLLPGEPLASAGAPIRLFDVKSGRQVMQLKSAERSVIAMAFSADGHQLVSVGDDGELRVWDASKGAQLRQDKLLDLSVAALSWDATYVVTGPSFRRGKMGLWKVETAERVRELHGYAYGWGPHAMDISRDGRLAVSGSQIDALSVVELESGHELLRLQSPDARFWSMAFSRDGRHLLTGMDDTTALVWDISKAQKKLAPEAKEKP